MTEKTFEEVMAQYENTLHKIIQTMIHKKDKSRLYDDCFQEASIGLWRAWITFDETKNIKFITYATCIVRNRLLKFLAQQRYQLNLSEYKYRQLGKYFKDKSKLSRKQIENIEKLLPLINIFDIDILEV